MPATLLMQLRKMTTIVADSADFESVSRFEPTDSTTSPSLIAAAGHMPQYESLVRDLLTETRRELGGHASDEGIVNLAFRRLPVVFGVKILERIPGRVSTEVDARLAFNKEATLAQAHDIVQQYQKAGISTARVLIKITATWEGIQAAKSLEAQGIHCNLTLVFGLHQAAACADAKATLVSPFVGRIVDWQKKIIGRTSSGSDDPGVQSVRSIYHYLKRRRAHTAVMAASFRNVEEIKQLAGCELMTISPALLSELDSTEGDLPRVLSPLAADGRPVQRPTLDRETFERMHGADLRAQCLLSQGIEGLSNSLRQLELHLATRLAAIDAGDRPARAASNA